MNHNVGLYIKYKIEKVIGIKKDGELVTCPIDPEADYFVLRLDKDAHARKAALAYAESIMDENPTLYEDITERCSEYERKAYTKLL
jgi:hypothetical protein